MNDVPAVIVNIQRQPGANVIEVVDRVKKLLPQLQASLPAAVKVAVLTDRTTTIRASVKDVQFELMLAVALVVLVIFLFLRNLAATIIPSVAVPLSLVGTFGVMYLLGFSLNNLSLMALTISTGFVVDDAIVMIENIARYIEEGEPPLQAALKGARADRLHHPVAHRLAHRRADPAAVHGRRGGPAVPRVRRHARRHDPHLGGGVADPDADDVRPAAQARARGAAGTLLPRLRTLLRRVIELTAGPALGAAPPGGDAGGGGRRRWSYGAAVCHRPEGLFPGSGHRAIQGISEAPQSVSFPAMAERQQALAGVILKDPAVESLSSFIGVDGTNTTLNSGRILINLKPLDEREVSASEVIRRLQPELARSTGIQLFMQPVQDLTVDARVSRTQYPVHPRGPRHR